MAVVQVPVTKSKAFVEIDTDKLPQDVYEAALLEGLKALANKGMSKITLKGLEGEELSKAHAAAQAKAEENAAAMLDGSIKLPGRKAKSKLPGEVMTEARRLAKNLLKDEMKKAGIKVSHVPAKEITQAVKDLLASDMGKSILDQAQKNIDARKAAPEAAGTISLASLLPDFDTLKQKGAESDAKAKERGKQLSAKQAGMTTKHKPKAQAAQTAH